MHDIHHSSSHDSSWGLELCRGKCPALSHSLESSDCCGSVGVRGVGGSQQQPSPLKVRPERDGVSMQLLGWRPVQCHAAASHLEPLELSWDSCEMKEPWVKAA